MQFDGKGRSKRVGHALKCGECGECGADAPCMAAWAWFSARGVRYLRYFPNTVNSTIRHATARLNPAMAEPPLT